MITGQFGRSIYVTVCILATMVRLTSVPTRAQELPDADAHQQTGAGALQGCVRDTTNKPVADVTISLQASALTEYSGTKNPAPQMQITHTDSEGRYRFPGLPEGVYVLRAQMKRYGDAVIGPLNISQKETKQIDVLLVSTANLEVQSSRELTPAVGKPSPEMPEFFDEPQFTVAGVTQATNSGGHGSDTVLRTTDALAKATVSLSKDDCDEANKEAGSAFNPMASQGTENYLRQAVSGDPDGFESNSQLGKLLVDEGKLTEAVIYLQRALRTNPKDADLYHRLGEAEEKLGNPLEAVRDYQRAAELAPSELYLLDWGTELLTHRALQPATEVLVEGRRLFPKSARMLVALGVAWYARGSYDQAARCLVDASDLAPGNPIPYLFLGRMQSVENTPVAGSVERLARFARTQPDNALANYYYAVALWEQSASATGDTDLSPQVEALLLKAVHLDPKLCVAYLQLGILYSQRGDFSHAISAYKAAIEASGNDVGGDDVNPLVSPQFVRPQVETLEESHYRLAQAYLRIGEKAKAQEQLQLHADLSKKIRLDTARQRREVQEFVISLRNQDAVSQ